MDIDTINEVNKVERRIEKELKNRLLNMTNQVKKQELWQFHFPTVRDDAFLTGNVF